MPVIRHKGTGVVAHVGDSHPALSGSDWERVEPETVEPAPKPRRRTRKADTED